MNDDELKRQLYAARTAALVVPSPWRATLEVTGKDRLTWLNGLVTCELAKRAPGDAVYGLLVAKNGRVQADVAVVVDETRVLLSLPQRAAEAIRTHLDHYLIMEEAEVAAGSDGFDTYAVHGPLAMDVLLAARAAGGVGGELDRTRLGGAIVLARKERDGDRDGGTGVRAAIERALAEIGGAFGDERTWETLRVEQSIPRFGVDFDGATYPQEAGLEKIAVSFSKGCYLGQEVVCMLEMRGKVKRKLVALELDGSTVPERGASVSANAEADVVAGEITSALASPTRGRPVAIAMVKAAHAEPGTVLRVGGARATIVGEH